MPNWRQGKPDGDEAWQIGDDYIRENNEALEEALDRHCIFPENPGGAASNVGRLRYETFADVSALNLAITTPIAGMRMLLTDHRQPFWYDGNAWRSLAPGVGTLAERDAFTTVLDGARWQATDGAGLTYVRNGATWDVETATELAFYDLGAAGPVAITDDPGDVVLSGPAVVVPSDGDDYRFYVSAFAELESLAEGTNNKVSALVVEYDVDGAGTWTELPRVARQREVGQATFTQEFTAETQDILESPAAGSYVFRARAWCNVTGNATNIRLTVRLEALRG